MDANALVQVGDEPSVLADRRLISDGLTVTGQNYVGSLLNDRDAWMDRIGRFLPVGFYYKAFYKPKGAWKRWEPYIRRKAGLGVVNTAAHHGYFDKEYLFADVADHRRRTGRHCRGVGSSERRRRGHSHRRERRHSAVL